MADSTKTRALPDIGAESAPPENAAAAAVPERPAWMASGKGPRGNRRRSPKTPTKPVSEAVANNADAGAKEAAPIPTFKERAAEWLKSATATGYGLSLLVHILLLTGMALWIFPQIAQQTSVTTVVESDVEAPQPLDAMDDVHLEVPAGSENVVVPQLTDAVQQETDLNVLEHKFLQDVTAAETQGEGGSRDVGSGGFRLLEPKNAVKAGSFTAWTIPIARHPGEDPKAGENPRPGQDYHIVIQVKIPGNRQVYNIGDLSGKVIGTDGYIQIIPAMAFIQDEEGRMIRANLGRRLPVVDGVVQILIRVPGAEALVKDTIRVNSKLLKEQQTLELIFGKHARRD